MTRALALLMLAAALLTAGGCYYDGSVGYSEGHHYSHPRHHGHHNYHGGHHRSHHGHHGHGGHHGRHW